MSNEPRSQSETQQVSEAFHLALAYLGYETFEESLAAWREIDPARSPEAATRLLRDMIALILSRRGMSRQLAIAYYRLVRALQTGSTARRPGDKEDRFITLGDLRREFRDLVEEAVPPTPATPSPEGRRAFQRARLDEPLPDLPVGGYDEEIELEDVDWFDDLDDQLDDIVEQIIEAEVNDNVATLERKIDRAGDNDKRRETEATRSAQRAAGSAQRAVQDAGRGKIYLAGGKDARVIGWVRVSRTGTPCPFCAMLLSRRIFYKTEKTAADPTNPDQYHPNCNCFAEAVYSERQFDTDPRFELNREMHQAWNRIAKGNRDGMSAWRRFIRERNKEVDPPEEDDDDQEAPVLAA